MASKNLTRAVIEALSYDPNGASRQVVWDLKVRGFGVRVTPGEGKQYVLSYRFNGRSRLMSLGRLDHFRTLEEARSKAQALLHGLRHEGVDPLATREQLSDSPSVTALWSQYQALHLDEASDNTRKAVGSLWVRHIEPAIGHLKPSQILASDLVRLHDKATRAGGEVTANRCIQRVRAFLNWAAERDERLFAADWKNPAAKVELHREHHRKHVLDAEQMRALVAALDEQSSPWVRVFVVLLMLTGARKEEIRTLIWANVDLERRIAVLPQTKNGEPMTLHLPPVVVDLLKALPLIANHPYVFPEQRKTTIEPRPMIEPRRAFKAALSRAGLPAKTTFHDLRRSYGTALARAGASAELVARALNNTSNVAAKVYVQLAANDVRRMAEANALALLPSAQS